MASKPKIKNDTLCSDIKHCGLKNVNIQKKIITLQCSWVRRLYDDYFHEWKVIPLKLIKKSFGSHFRFHSNILFNISCINDFLSFYLDIFCNWKKYFSTNPETPSCILSQYLRFNKFIIVDNSYVNFTNFSTKSINFVSDLVNENCNFKSWETLKNDYHLDNKLYFQWMQLIQAIPLIWKQKINDSEKNVEKSYVVQDHHLIRNTRIIALAKLTAREIYSVLLLSSSNTPTSQKYFVKVFPNENFDWKKIYILPNLVTVNSFQRNFQYKILHNILYLNKMLFTFGKTKTPLCSFCHLYDETIKHIFLECIYVKQLWNHLRLFLTNDTSLPIITPQTAIFRVINRIENNVYKTKNRILLIFKLHVYKCRESRLINEIKKVKLLEKNSAQNHVRKLEQYNIKWEKTHRAIKI